MKSASKRSAFAVLAALSVLAAMLVMSASASAAKCDVDCPASDPGKASSLTVLTSSANPSVYGQSVTLTAKVSDNPNGIAPIRGATTGTATPTGKVTFKEGTTVLAPDVALDANGNASYTTSSFNVGAHTIKATYSGDATYNASQDALTQTVNKDTTKLHASANPTSSVYGQSVSFAENVTTDSPGTATPSGNVTWSGPFSHTGPATGDSFSTTALPVGTDHVSLSYPGDGNTNGSTAGLDVTVSKASTTTTLSQSSGQTTYPKCVTYTATVGVVAPGSGAPTGKVAFSDSGTDFRSASVNGSGHATVAGCLAPGTHHVTATYLGDGNFDGSPPSNQVDTTVSKADSSTTLASSANPADAGQVITLTASLDTSLDTPTGTVTFKIDGSATSPQTVDGNGNATYQTTLAPGSHSISASYSGDSNFNPSSSTALTQVVKAAPGSNGGNPGGSNGNQGSSNGNQSNSAANTVGNTVTGGGSTKGNSKKKACFKGKGKHRHKVACKKPKKHKKKGKKKKH